MDDQKRQAVHGILFSWLVLRFKEKSERQDTIRLLFRLTHHPQELASLMLLGRHDVSFKVFSTLMWAFHRKLGDMLPSQALASFHKTLPTIHHILQSASLSKRLLCCDTIRKVWRRLPTVPISLVETPIRRILRHHPRHEHAVLTLSKFFLDIPSLPPLEPYSLLPCGGMGWVKAIEYFCGTKYQVTDPRWLAPTPSSHDLDYLVSLWPVEVQRYFLQMASSSKFEHLKGGKLESVLEAISYVHKVPFDMGIVLPGVLFSLENMDDKAMTTDQRFYLKESAWRILEKMSGNDMAPYSFSILKILSGERGRGKAVVEKLVHHVTPDLLPSLIPHLPDFYVKKNAALLCQTLDETCCQCYPRKCLEAGCFDVCCLVDEQKYRGFIMNHLEVFMEAITHKDREKRISAMTYLPRLPATIFDAVFGLLERMVSFGNVPLILTIQNLPPVNMQRFLPILRRRVLEDGDVYSEEGGASAALLTLSKFPPNVLGNILVSWDGGQDVAVYLFVLCHMPRESLDLFSLKNIVLAKWDDCPEIAARLVFHAKDPRICEGVSAKCVEALTNFAYQEYAAKILTLLPRPALERILDSCLEHIPSPYDCLLLGYVSTSYLQTIVGKIVNLCWKHPLVESYANLLSKVPSLPPTVLALCDRYEDLGLRWRAIVGILKKLGEHHRADELVFARAF